MSRIIFTLLLFISPFAGHCQYKITGSVTVKGETPFPGITVVEKGTDNGTLTDLKGNFELTVSDPDAVLVSSFVGMITKDTPLKGKQHAVITTEWDCIVDFFDSNDVNIYLSSGVINTPIGGRLELSSPWFLHGVVKGAYGYQTGSGNNELHNAEAGLYHYITNCDFNMNFSWYYRRISSKNEMNSRANSFETDFNTGLWTFIAGYSHLTFKTDEVDESLSGLVVGVSVIIPRPYLEARAKTSLYKNRVEYQASLSSGFRSLRGFIRFYKLNTFNELSIGAGVHLNYLARPKQKSQ